MSAQGRFHTWSMKDDNCWLLCSHFAFPAMLLITICFDYTDKIPFLWLQLNRKSVCVCVHSKHTHTLGLGYELSEWQNACLVCMRPGMCSKLCTRIFSSMYELKTSLFSFKICAHRIIVLDQSDLSEWLELDRRQFQPEFRRCGLWPLFFFCLHQLPRGQWFQFCSSHFVLLLPWAQ